MRGRTCRLAQSPAPNADPVFELPGHGHAGMQHNRLSLSRHPKFTNRPPIREAGCPIQVVRPDFPGKDLVAKNLLFEFSKHRAFACYMKSHCGGHVDKVLVSSRAQNVRLATK